MLGIIILCTGILFHVSGFFIPPMMAARGILDMYLQYFSMAKDVVAASKTEFDLTAIPEGKTTLISWRYVHTQYMIAHAAFSLLRSLHNSVVVCDFRSKPLYVRHRTQAEIESEGGVDLSQLRDPQHDNDRVKKSEWLIVIGICTHLGL